MLALALGATTLKMHHGHRGANHPVKNLDTGKVEITSQNHGFVVERNSLPAGVVETYTSLFDNTVEGIRPDGKPVFSVQHHPEASPGPQDSQYLFDQFVALMDEDGIDDQTAGSIPLARYVGRPAQCLNASTSRLL